MSIANDSPRFNYQDDFVATLAKLIGIPSRSSPAGGEEGEIQAYVEHRMRALGARVHTFEASDYPEFFTHPVCCGPKRQYEGRPTVIGEIGPEGAEALLIVAHSDTVPIFEPDAWTGDPFTARIIDGKIYGLGAGDDKWGTATLLSLLRYFLESPEELKKRLVFASTIDEEHGVGNGLLLLALAGIEAESALYLDGCDNAILLGHLGGSHFILRPKTGITQETLAGDHQSLAAACRKLSKSREGLFDRPLLHDNLMRPQSVIGDLTHDADGPHLKLRFYTVEGEDPAAVQAELEQLISDSLGPGLNQRYDVSIRLPWFEPLLTDAEIPLVRSLSSAHRNVMGADAVITRGSKQDAFVLSNYAGIPTVSFGASRSQLPGCFHAPDEYVDIDFAWKGFRIAFDAICDWQKDGCG